MEENEKYLDDFTSKIIKKTPLDNPSGNFTDAILHEINIKVKNEVTIYKELISKKIIILLCVALIGLLFFAVFNFNQNATNWLAFLSMEAIPQLKIPEMVPNITFSSKVLYAVIIFSLVFFVQISFLKKYFDERLDY